MKSTFSIIISCLIVATLASPVAAQTTAPAQTKPAYPYDAFVATDGQIVRAAPKDGT